MERLGERERAWKCYTKLSLRHKVIVKFTRNTVLVLFSSDWSTITTHISKFHSHSLAYMCRLRADQKTKKWEDANDNNEWLENIRNEIVMCGICRRSTCNVRIPCQHQGSFTHTLKHTRSHTLVNKESVTISSKLCNMKCSCKNSIIVNFKTEQKMEKKREKKNTGSSVFWSSSAHSRWSRWNLIERNERGDDMLCQHWSGNCSRKEWQKKSNEQTFHITQHQTEKFQVSKLYFNNDSSAANATSKLTNSRCTSTDWKSKMCAFMTS